MKLIEKICQISQEYVDGRCKQAIAYLTSEIETFAAKGSFGYTYFNLKKNFSLSETEVDEVINYFAEEGFSVYISGGDITISWSWIFENSKCPQCGRHHTTTCEEKDK